MSSPADAITSVPIFEDGQILRAADLNTAFELMRLLRAAPPGPGLFRPWWARNDANLVTWDNDTLTIHTCFAVCPDGMPVAIRNLEHPLRDGETFCVASNGHVSISVADVHAPARDDCLILATACNEDPLQRATVATCNATQRLEDSFERMHVVASEWIQAIADNTPRSFFALASMWRNLHTMPPATETATALRRMSDVAFAVSLLDSKLIPPSLFTVPEPREHGAVCSWLKTWITTLTQRDLQRFVYG